MLPSAGASDDASSARNRASTASITSSGVEEPAKASPPPPAELPSAPSEPSPVDEPSPLDDASPPVVDVPERVAAARPLERPGLRFVRGGFEVPSFVPALGSLVCLALLANRMVTGDWRAPALALVILAVIGLFGIEYRERPGQTDGLPATAEFAVASIGSITTIMRSAMLVLPLPALPYSWSLPAWPPRVSPELNWRVAPLFTVTVWAIWPGREREV